MKIDGISLTSYKFNVPMCLYIHINYNVSFKNITVYYKILREDWVREYIISFGAETFAIQKFKDYDKQNYNFACYFVWLWNVVNQIEGET